MYKIILVLLFFAHCAMAQHRNDLTFGVATDGDFYLWQGAKDFIFFADYKRSLKNYFLKTRAHFSTFTYYGPLHGDGYWGNPISGITWIESGYSNAFVFKDQVTFNPKNSGKHLQMRGYTATIITASALFGYQFKLGNRKRFSIEPAIGYAYSYFRDDAFWEYLPVTLGTYDTFDPNYKDVYITNLSTTRGLIHSFAADLTLRHYFGKRYSWGLNVDTRISPYFNIFNYGGFIGINF